MNDLIRQIYATREVQTAAGKTVTLDCEISPEEGELLAGLITDDASVCRTLEVGCAYGLSSLFICEALRERAGAHHTVIDPVQMTDWQGIGVHNLRRAGLEGFELVEAYSEFALPRLLEAGEGRFDLILIDGWHTFDHASLDCFYASRLLREGGYLVIDDVSFPAVRQLVDFYLNFPCYRHAGSVAKRNTRDRGLRLLGQGLMLPLPARTRRAVLKRLWRRRVQSRAVETMVALQKTGPDQRRWDWHCDDF